MNIRNSVKQLFSALSVILLCSTALVACGGAPTTHAISQEDIAKLGFDPATLQESKGAIGEPGLPAGFTYKVIVPAHKYDEPDVIALDPSGKYLYFITHLAYPDGAAYRVDIATGDTMRLTTGLHRPGGIEYYAPGKTLVVSEEGTGTGPLERELGFFRAVLPDVPDQPKPPPLRAMGQYRGEGIAPASANTIYLGEDQPNGGHLYKYVLDNPPDLTRGTLYTLKENQGWVKTAYLDAPDTGKEGTAYYAGEGVRIGPDGKIYFALTAEAETRIVAIDPTTSKATNFVTAGKTKGLTNLDWIVFAPNGTLFLTNRGDIWAALPDSPDSDTLSDGVYPFLKGLDNIQGMEFSNDGSTLYVSARGNADVVLAVSGFKFH